MSGGITLSKRVNFLLFLLTLLTTTAAGAWQAGVNPFEGISYFLKGTPFSLTLMSILLAHEMGHYFTSKRHKVLVTLPYFIPAPSLIGTFGAVIKIKSPMQNKKALLDVGVAGPLIGIIITVPVLIIGLSLSEIKVMEEPQGMLLGESLLFSLLAKVTIGDLPEHHHIILHPMAFAGWIGLLVTSLNLIPAGQLDGGHIAYALLGDQWYRRICIFTLLVLIIFGFLGWQGWFIWAALLYVFGFKHPMPLDFWTPLDKTRKLVGILAMSLLFLTFTPIPLRVL